MQIPCAIFCDGPVPSLSIVTDSSFFSCVCFGGEVQKWAEAELELVAQSKGWCISTPSTASSTFITGMNERKENPSTKGWWLRRMIDYGSGLRLIVIAMDSGKGGRAKHGRKRLIHHRG
jgi:hypothetical protein